MKYYSYEAPDEFGRNIIITTSEEEIRLYHYPLWLNKMYKVYGKEFVDEHFCFLDCIDQWLIENKAWESINDEK